MKNHTASGPDDIPIELFRVPEIRQELLDILNDLLDQKQLPEHVTRGFLSPIYKRKGNSADPSNYRPVALLSQCLKVLNKMILIRMRNALDPFLIPSQAAYRENRSTLHHILALQQLIHRSVKAKDSPLYAVFCDFSKCFDSVHRDKLSAVLDRYGVPQRLSSFVLRSMDQQHLAVKFAGNTPTAFDISPRFGVMQGCTLAPFLFVLVMDVILRTLQQQQGVLLSGRDYLAALAYADDVILLAQTPGNAQRLTDQFKYASSYFGFSMNPGIDKTTSMVFGNGPKTPITLDRTALPYCDSYKYLGSMITPAADWKIDFAKRKKQAWCLVRRFKDIWVSVVPPDTKRRLFHALIVPVLMYAAPAYPAIKTMRYTLHVACNALLRRALNTTILWRDPDIHNHIHTEALYGTMPTLPAMLAYQMVNSWGHYVRNTPNTPVINVFTARMQLKNRRTHTRFGPLKSLEATADRDITSLMTAARLSADHSDPRNRKTYDQIALDAVLRVELEMYNDFILKRRLGGKPSPGECSVICDGRAENVLEWWTKISERSARR